MANTFQPQPPIETVKAMLSARLQPDTMARLVKHAKANKLRPNELVTQILEYEINKLGEPVAVTAAKPEQTAPVHRERKAQAASEAGE